jgi:hypothetical protein
MKNEKRFKLGDNITYKSKNDCVDEYGDKGRYHYDGDDQDGFVGEVLKYDYYKEEKDCWKIYVTTKGGGLYYMLECEFLEYDKQPTTSELFPIY